MTGSSDLAGCTPARRRSRPEERVGAATIPASRASDHVDGQIIDVDGEMLETP